MRSGTECGRRRPAILTRLKTDAFTPEGEGRLVASDVILESPTPPSSMSNQFDYFSDLLDSEESVRATLAGPGPDDSGSAVWHQIAATETRLLAVELRATASGSWRPHQRTAAPLSRIQMERHERTAADPARLVIHGLDRPLTVIDIDQPDVFPMVEPLIVAWGGRLGGTGTERPAPQSTLPPASPVAETSTNQRTLLIVLGCIGLMIAGCATAGCLGVIVTAALEPT